MFAVLSVEGCCFCKWAGNFLVESEWQSVSLTSQWLSSLVREMSRPWCCSLSWSNRACQRFSSSCDSLRDIFSSLLWFCSPSYSWRKCACFCDSLQTQSQLLEVMWQNYIQQAVSTYFTNSISYTYIIFMNV